ncbi:MAG TPA: ribose-5-phosphate isomerase RpiA [Deltaproteobacteria bacterium]|nr:ribose-5-phosphate isomerase RpiA [Deltaproteobacteria bacterium]
MNRIEEFKKQAAFKAVEQIASGMVIGLGTGSTAKYAVERIGELYQIGELKGIVGIPSSVQTEKLALAVGLPLTTFETHPVIDINIDGADEVDVQLNLIKGGGGALLREKVIAQASRRNVIIVDETKISDQLGTNWALPIEVVPFAGPSEKRFLEELGAKVTIRKNDDGSLFKTDQNNLILDADFGPMTDPAGLAAQLDNRAGIAGQGLFIGLTREVIIAGGDGIRHMTR